MENTLKLKGAYLRDNFVNAWIPNALANGLIYYLLKKNASTKIIDFWIGGTITAFILALICGSCNISTIDKKIKSGKLKPELFVRKNHIIQRLMPDKTVSQLFFIAFVVTVVFTFVSAALPFVCVRDFSASIPVLPGSIVHGIQCGFMGLLTVHFAVLGRFKNLANHDAEKTAAAPANQIQSKERNTDTMLLYTMSKKQTVNMRLSVEMNDTIDGDILKTAVNDAVKRYPYFLKKLIVNENNNYEFIDNNKPIVVTKTTDSNPVLGGKDANEHYLTVDYDEFKISFNMIHALTNGPSFMELALTTLEHYVNLKEKVTLNCPNIRKIDSPFLPDECDEIKESDLCGFTESIWKGHKNKKIKTYSILRGYLRCMLQHKGVDNYYLISIDEKELMQYIKQNDGSPASFFSVIMFKAAAKWMPKKYEDVEIASAVCMARAVGMKNCYKDTTMVASTRYKRNMAEWSTQKLCTMTRGNLFLQSDESVAADFLKNKLRVLDKVLMAKTFREKRKISHEANPHTFAILPMTADISYIGKYELGDLSGYIKNIAGIVDGEGMLESLSFNNKFYITFLQKDKHERWLKSFLSVLDEEKVDYKIEGPFNKNLSKGILPK